MEKMHQKDVRINLQITVFLRIVEVNVLKLV